MRQQELDKIWEDLGGKEVENALYDGKDDKWDKAIEKWEQKIKELGGRFYCVAEDRHRSIKQSIEELSSSLATLGIDVVINTPYEDHEEQQPVIFFKKEN